MYARYKHRDLTCNILFIQCPDFLYILRQKLQNCSELNNLIILNFKKSKFLLKKNNNQDFCLLRQANILFISAKLRYRIIV